MICKQRINIHYVTGSKTDYHIELNYSKHSFKTRLYKGSDEFNIGNIIVDQHKRSDQLYDLTLLPEDNIMDLKNKIYLKTNILPYMQFLSPKTYDLVIDNHIYELDPPKYDQDTSTIIYDEHLYKNQENIYVIGYDHSITLMQYLNNNKPIDLYVYEQIESEQADQLYIYYGYVIKYYPMISREVYQNYHKPDITVVYPELFPNKQKLYEYYVSQHNIIEHKYKLYESVDFLHMINPDMQRSDIANQVKHIRTNIIQAGVANYKDDWVTCINIKHLFDRLQTSHNMPIIRMSSLQSRKTIIITKLRSKNWDIYNKHKEYLQLNHYNQLMILLIYEDIDVVLVIMSNLKVNIRVICKKKYYNFDEIFDQLKQQINKLITHINDLGREIFTSYKRLELINKINHTFLYVEIDIRWKIAVTNKQYQSMLNELANYSSLFKHIEAEKYRFTKAAITIPDDFYDHINNYYGSYSDLKQHQRFQAVLNEPNVTITHEALEVVFRTKNMNENQYLYFYEFIMCFIYSYKFQDDKGQEITVKHKSLKKFDPLLFKLEGDLLYSRICQKPNQPTAYTQDEYSNLSDKARSKLIKYWNFSINKPVYYACNNPKYPYLNFITGKHPNNYCIPCCKILDPTSDSSSKKAIYDKCLTDYKHTESKVQQDHNSRYIKVFTDSIDVGRISYLPSLLEKYISSKQQNLMQTFVYYQSSKYSINKLSKICKTNKEYELDVNSDLFNKLLTLIDVRNLLFEVNSINQYIDSVMANPELFKRLDQYALDPDILVYENRKLNKTSVVLGSLNLIKHKIQSKLSKQHTQLKYKYITMPQLNKAEATHESLIIKDNKTKVQDYYLIGIPQIYENHKNAGLLYAASLALKLSPRKFIDLLIQKIQSAPDYLQIQYFNNKQHLIQELNSIGIIEDQTHNWDQILKHLLLIYFKISVIVLEVEDEIDMLKPNNYGEMFLVLIKINKKLDYDYYPVFQITPQNYFKATIIDQTIYDINDFLINSLLEFDTVDTDIINQLTVDQFSQIDSVYINNQNEVHAVISHGCYFSVRPYYEPNMQYKINTEQIELAGHKKWLDHAWDLFNTQKSKTIQTELTMLKLHDKIIGCIVANSYHLFSPANQATFADNATSIGFYVDHYVKEMMYHPIQINLSIMRPAKQLYSDLDIKKALYNKYCYDMLVIKLFNILEQEKNHQQRSKYKQDPNQAPLEIQKLLINNQHNVFDANHYEFDNMTLANILKQTHRDQIIPIIRPILDTVVTKKIPDYSKLDLDNIDNIYVPELLYNSYISIMADELANPLRKHLFISGSFIKQIRNYYRHDNRPGQELYVLVK
jgi:hypothetical protein